jgi:hypothetical protein
MSSREPEAGVPVPAASQSVVEAPASLAVPALPAASARRAVPAVTERPSALARVQAAAGQLAPRVQYQLARLGVAGQAGLASLTVAAVIAVSALIPAQHALQSLSADIVRAQHVSATAMIEQAVPRLVASIPTRMQMPAVLGQVYAEAQAANVPLDTGHYVYTPAKAGGIARYDLDFPVKASYPNIRTFINRTLTVVPAAALDKLHVERKAVGEELVNADIGFVVFVRE